MSETKRCPYCNELINLHAKKCKHCGEWLEEKEKPSTTQNAESTTLTDPTKTVRLVNQVYGRINLEDLPEGHLIDNRYEIKEKIGQGGFGAVYRAYDRKIKVDKALKVIPEAVSNDKRAMATFEKESRTMINLNHSGIVRFYDFHDEGTVKYIDMEYVEGKTLNDLLLDYPNERMPEEKVTELAIPICEALEYAHNKGVIHRDIKPQNIMLTNTGEIKIMDFGIAETLRNSMSRLQPTSSSGTLIYMSPEQISGKAIRKTSDIYSLGAALYELLSGKPPFHSGDITYQILYKEAEDIEGVSDKLNKILLKCLSKEQQNRFENLKKLKSSLTSNVITLNNPKSIEIDESEKLTNKQSVSERVDQHKNIVLVEGGWFKMGSQNGDKDERPVHSVKVDDFYISKYAVTQDEYEEVMGTNPSNIKGVNRPVEQVSWYNAVEYCNKLSENEGLTKFYNINGTYVTMNWDANGYRLPTEAEWEFAARGGNQSNGYTYSGSDNIDYVAEYDGFVTQSVGTKDPNELGIYDMSGNVWEWCSDWYDSDYYDVSPENNPQGPSTGSYRVRRGGSWNDNAYYCRSANRDDYNPGVSNVDLGFRVAGTP